MEYIRLQRTQPNYNPNTRHALHGLDADLIMLALATHEPHFTIVREMVTFGKTDKCAICGQIGHTADQCKGEAKKKEGENDELPQQAAPAKPFQFLHINVLREYLDKEFGQGVNWDNFTDGFNVERVIDDWVFMCFLVGNDFLPHLPSLDIREGAIDTLMDLYKKLVPKSDGFLTSNGDVNLGRVEKFVSELGLIENEVLHRRRMKEQKFQDRKRKRDQDVKSGKCGKQHAQMLKSFAAPSDGFQSQRSKVDGVQRFHPDQARPDHRATPRDASLLKLFNSIKGFNEADTSAAAAEAAAAEAEELPAFLDLAAELSPFERAMAHQYCDELGLSHKSVGDGPDRHIRVARLGLDLDNMDAADAFKELVDKGLKAKNEHLKEQVDEVQIGTDNWKERYYDQKLDAGSPEGVMEVVRTYVQGLCWVMAYYYKGCQSWAWYYPHHYAPAASDLHGLEKLDVSYQMEKPFLPFEQLMGVFPARTGTLPGVLPVAYHPLMSDSTSPIYDFYPTQFKLDMNGKKQSWQAVVLLPFIDEVRLRAALAPHDDKLSEEEKRRNSHALPTVHVGAGHKLRPQLEKVCSKYGMLPEKERLASWDNIEADGKECTVSGSIAAYHDPLLPSPMVMVGDQYPDLDFCGTETEHRYVPAAFLNQAIAGLVGLPAYTVHLPDLLPNVTLPTPVLTESDECGRGSEFVPAMQNNYHQGRNDMDRPDRRMIHHHIGNGEFRCFEPSMSMLLAGGKGYGKGNQGNDRDGRGKGGYGQNQGYQQQGGSQQQGGGYQQQGGG